MRIRYEIHFAIWSDSVSADRVTSFLGFEPDSLLERASRRESPPVPVMHMWEIKEAGGSYLSEQVETMLARLRRSEELLVALRRDLLGDDGHFELQVVRIFECEEPAREGEMDQIGRGISFALDAEDVALLSRIGASVSMDEYVDFVPEDPPAVL